MEVRHQDAGDRGRDRIELRLSFGGDLSLEQRSRLQAISRRCPVHRMLAGGVELVEE